MLEPGANVDATVVVVAAAADDDGDESDGLTSDRLSFLILLKISAFRGFPTKASTHDDSGGVDDSVQKKPAVDTTMATLQMTPTVALLFVPLVFILLLVVGRCFSVIPKIEGCTTESRTRLCSCFFCC